MTGSTFVITPAAAPAAALLTPAEVKAQIKTALTDDELQDVIDREEAEIIRLYGVNYVDAVQTITETLEGGEASIYLRRPITSVVSITEDDLLIESAAYRVWPAQGRIEKISGIQNWLSGGDTDTAVEWGEVIVIVYKPADDNIRRKAVLLNLVRLALERTALQSESIAGEYSYTAAANWDEQRSELLASLGFPDIT